MFLKTSIWFKFKGHPTKAKRCTLISYNSDIFKAVYSFQSKLFWHSDTPDSFQGNIFVLSQIKLRLDENWKRLFASLLIE